MNNLPKIADLESIYCRLPYSRQLTFAPLVDATPSQFLCPYQTHCFALCHCCDYDACDCEMACPVGCSCYHDATWNTNIVECSSSNFTDLPVKLPMDATELLLDGNNLLKLKSHTFIGRKNLRTLYLNNSNIEVKYLISNKNVRREFVLNSNSGSGSGNRVKLWSLFWQLLCQIWSETTLSI